MADVFISYKSERRNAAQHLTRILELNGYSVWFDYGLLSGRDFGPQIEREIRAAKAVVVLWCGLSRESRWVLEEAELAMKLGTLTPALIERVDPPLGFARADNIDLTTWDGAPRSHRLDRLLDQIAQRVGRDPVPQFRGMQTYEETWRAFGAPALKQFKLISPVAEREEGRLGTEGDVRELRDREAREQHGREEEARRKTEDDEERRAAEDEARRRREEKERRDVEEDQRTREAEARLAKRRSEEQRIFAAAKRDDGVLAVDNSLTDNSDSNSSGERAMPVSRVDAYKNAMASNDATILRAFLNSYPTGAAADEVRGKLRRLESHPWQGVLLVVCALGVVLIGLGLFGASTASLLVIFLVGPLVGWLTGRTVGGSGFGLIGDLAIGAVGAFVGEVLLVRIGIHIGAGIVSVIINSTIGAALLVLIAHLLRVRR